MLGGDTIWRVHRDADPTTHADAVDQRDVRLRVGGDHQVQFVFLAEERLGFVVLAIKLVLAQRADVAAGAERPVARALDDHRVHLWLIAPSPSAWAQARIIARSSAFSA